MMISDSGLLFGAPCRETMASFTGDSTLSSYINIWKRCRSIHSIDRTHPIFQ